MIYFEIVLLLLGFVISIITLLREGKEENRKLKKVLSFAYIAFCLISLVFAVVKYTSNMKSDNKLFKSLGDIEGTINVQGDKLFSLLDKIIDLNHKMDNIASKTEIAIKQREESLKIFEEQNKLLEKSNKLTELKIINDSANVEIYGATINFLPIDSTKYKYVIPFYNTGKRNATRFSDLIVFVFKNKNGIYFRHELTNSAYREGGRSISPYSNNTATSLINLDKNYLKRQTSGGTLVIYYRYYDTVLKKYYTQESRFEFSNNWDQNIYNILNEGKPASEIGLDEYLLKNNIKSSLDIY